MFVFNIYHFTVTNNIRFTAKRYNYDTDGTDEPIFKIFVLGWR